MVLTRQLGPSGYGRYVFVMTFATTVSIPIRLGLPKLALRETAKSFRAGEIAQMHSIWRWAHLFMFCSVGAGAVVAIAASLLFPMESDFAIGMLIGCLLVPLISLGELRAAILRGLGKIILGQLPEGVIRPVLFLSIVAILIYVTGVPITANSALALQLLSSFVAFSIGALLLIWFRPKRSGERILLDNKRGLVWSALLLGSVSGFHTLNANLDSLMLRMMISDSAVGIYKAALLYSSLVGFGLQAVITIISPRIAQNANLEDRGSLQKLARESTKLIFALALAPAVVYFWFGSEMLEISFGEEFKQAEKALIVLTAGQLLSAFFGPVGAILSMTGHEKVALRAVFASSVLNVILNFALIPMFGLVGAAIATGSTTILWNFLLWFEVRRKLNVNTLALR